MSEDQILEWTKRLTALRAQIDPLFDSAEGRTVLEELSSYINNKLDLIEYEGENI